MNNFPLILYLHKENIFKINTHQACEIEILIKLLNFDIVKFKIFFRILQYSHVRFQEKTLQSPNFFVIYTWRVLKRFCIDFKNFFPSISQSLS